MQQHVRVHRECQLARPAGPCQHFAETSRGQHRVEARALLGSVYGRFTEGFATADPARGEKLA